jgi:TPR repeat protein
MRIRIWWCILSILFVAGLAANRRIEDHQTELDQLNFGAKYGLSKDGTITSENLNRIIAGAESGNRDNLYFLGLLKLYGNSVNKNPIAAMEHILAAAQLGLPEAMTAYGVMHYIGINVEKDHAIAFDWLRKATALHDSNAHWFLGKMYMETGSGDIEAITHFSMAAEKGIPQALHYLGLMNEYGRGLPQNLLLASEYYRRAVELGYVESMYNLALMYCEGRGVEQNFNAAIPLFEAGVSANHAPSMYMMGVMRLQVTFVLVSRTFYHCINSTNLFAMSIRMTRATGGHH